MIGTRREFLQAGGALCISFTIPACGNDGSPAVAGRVAIGSRLIVDASGKVLLNIGKVELGQGIGTALAQVAADELGVDIARVRLVGVDTAFSPDESYTFSSISVQQSVPPLRNAAASGRQHLFLRAATESGIPVERLRVEDGVFFQADNALDLDYWRLLAGNSTEITPSDDAPAAAEPRSVGQSVERFDIPGKVFGDDSFLQDLHLDGMLHGRVVRPPSERATFVGMDKGAVTSMEGVQAVVRDGNFLAVVATRESQARAAAQALRNGARWNVANDLPDADSIYDWLKKAPSRVEQVSSSGSVSDTPADGRSISASYQRPYQAHASISPAAAVALFEEGRLTIWSHAQGMYPLRTAIAHTLGLAEEKVRCVYRQAAGCYGHNGADDAACDAAAIAMQLPGRPIRLQWERADEFAWEPWGSAMHIETSATLDADGRVDNWRFDIWSCPHTSRPRNVENAGNFIYAQHKESPLPIPPPRSIPQPNGGSDRNAVPLYAFPSREVRKHLVTDVPVRVSSLRGLGAYANVFAIESFMDELSIEAGVDPFEFRIAHLEDERAVKVLERLRELSGWRRRLTSGEGEGWGVGFARFKNLSSYVGVVFKVGVDMDSGVVILRHADAVCDAGFVINPDGVKAQIEGGIVQSASWTLKEQMRFSSSRIESRDWASYPILRFDEVPTIDVQLMERPDQKSLGVGEAAQGPAAAALANAVYHAVGKRVRTLPLTPQRIKAT